MCNATMFMLQHYASLEQLIPNAKQADDKNLQKIPPVFFYPPYSEAKPKLSTHQINR